MFHAIGRIEMITKFELKSLKISSFGDFNINRSMALSGSKRNGVRLQLCTTGIEVG